MTRTVSNSRLIFSLLALWLGLLPYFPVLANTGITVEWEKTFDGKTWGRADSIIQMPDGGFAVTNQSFTKSDPDVWLLKLDSGGHWQWEHSFSGSGYDLANAIIPTRDRGFALVGANSIAHIH